MSENNHNDVHIHDENCDHDHEEVVILTDHEGNEREFIIVEELAVADNRYAVMVAADGAEEDGVIMRIESEENGEEYLIDIEDEEEWNRVVTAYNSLVDDAE